MLTGEALKQLQAIESDLKEVTARKSQLLRDAQTLEARVRRVAETTSSATYSLHAQRLVPGAVFSNPNYHGLVGISEAHALKVMALEEQALYENSVSRKEEIKHQSILKQVR